MFRSRIPREAIDFVAKLLVYDPNQRPRPLVALVDSYFNELRDPATRLPNGQPLPDLFNFTPEEIKDNPGVVEHLVPSWYQQKK